MRAILPLLLPGAVFVVAWWLTGQFRRYALSQQLLDVPNARSSHVVATPRGGGMAIVLTVLATLPVLGALGEVSWPTAWGLVGGGALVALVGFADDHGHIAPMWRLLGHVIAASWILAWLGGLPPLRIFGFALESGWIGYGLALLYLVWLLNVTNFMDGIDGIAGVEAIFAGVGGALLVVIAAPGNPSWQLGLLVASATLGFLVWNWPPAKVFMGDAGSGFLGLVLAALSLESGHVAPQLFWSWLIMLGVFVVDATITLLLRIARGETFYEAHRSHAYQHAARQWGAHRPVTLAVVAINVGWLFPVALLVALGRLDGPAGLLLAYAPLFAAAIYLKAGKPATS